MEPRGLTAAFAAMGALHLWAMGLSCDIAADGVTLNTIQPGRIDSEQIREKLHPTEQSRAAFIERNIPIGHFGEPADVAHLVACHAAHAARYITGAVIPVDGGMHYFAH
jgi:3-oxoacyl-[acyl-carrier protein] reductase